MTRGREERFILGNDVGVRQGPAPSGIREVGGTISVPAPACADDGWIQAPADSDGLPVVFLASAVKDRGSRFRMSWTSFEETARAMKLSAREYASSVALKEWVRKNKDRKYVPLDLLNVWGFEVTVE